MARRRTRAPKEKQRKRVTVKLLEREHAGKVTQPYRIMEELVAKHHQHLAEAKIAIAWRFGWKPDADGRLILGRCKKGSDLDRELNDYDFVILLNHEVWNSAGFSEKQMRALVDHELCHCQRAIDANGEPKQDEQGRTVYRVRKHDLEEFREVVRRNGLYTADLEEFARAAIERLDQPLLKTVG